MSNIPVSKKREWAELLFARTTLTQKEIAERVDVTQKTLCKWKEKYNWEQLRTSFYITKGQELQRIYQQISSLNTIINNREQKYATTREADTISKLASAAKSLETTTSIADIIDVFIEFTNWLRENDFSKAKEISELMDNYIKSKLK